MVLQCEQCKTRFRLDDSKIKEGGVKVRCSKCKHVFVVYRDVPQEEADFDSILSNLGSTAAAPQPVHVEAGPPPLPEDAAAGQEPAPFAASEDEAVQGAEGVSANDAGFDFGEFSLNDEPPATPPDFAAVDEAPAVTDAGFDFGSFSFDSDEEVAEGTPAGAGDALGVRDGADAFSSAEEQPLPQVDEDLALKGEECGAFEFPPVHISLDEEPAADTTTATEEEFSFGFEDDAKEETGAGSESPETFSMDAFVREERPADFTFTKGGGGLLSDEPKEAPAPPAGENTTPKGDGLGGETESFDFEPIDFGEVAVPASVEEAKGAPEPAVAADSALAAPTEEVPVFVPPVEDAVNEDELPPLSISSRRKGSSVFTVAVLTVSLLVLLVLAGGGFFFLKNGPTAFNTVGLGFMAKWFGLDNVDEGGITVKNPVGSFITSKGEGELFVISGEAVNGFRKPRATIQVKATLFGKNGTLILQKSAYCGNRLTKEQLATLPMAKIEAAMSNQFGDSLSNLGVQPGKGIPFVIVFANVPKDVVEFGVEVAGSTVASQ